MSEKQKKIWITGASSGIGKALAEKFANENWKVAVSARRENLLNEMAKNKNIFAFPLDVTEDEKVKNIFVGIEMVKQQFADVLKGSGLEEISSVGEAFDPNFHEALMQREEEGKDAGVILEEVQKGYRLNGRVLRAAKVIISK